MHPAREFALITLLVAGPLFSQDAAVDKLPVPEPAAQKEQEALIRKIFKDEYAKNSSADKLALGLKLLQQAAETKDNATTRFVLLREARDLTAESGDSLNSLKAVDLMAAEFKIAPFPMKAAALSAAAKAVRSPEDLKRLAAAFLKLSDDALAADEIETATQAAARASSTARTAKDAPLVAKADARSKELGDLKSKAESVRKAKEILAANPEDVAANATMGEFLCMVKGDWPAGLPFLAKGSEGRLRELARADLSQPSSALELVALADGWWELADRDRGRAQENLRRRAISLYEQALPGLSGIHQLKVSQRLNSGAPSWFALGLFAHWKLDEGSGDVINDSSGNRRNGKIEGATWVKGLIGGALHFDGNRQKVLLDAGDVPPPWTAAIWVKREESPNATARLMDAVGYQKGTSLRLEQSTNTKKVGITKHKVVDHPFEYTAPPNTWVHLTWVGTDKTVSLYANGAIVGTLELSMPLSVERLGSQDDSGMKGCLDDIRIYSRQLTPNEIERIYQHGRR